jgi:thermitase
MYEEPEVKAYPEDIITNKSHYRKLTNRVYVRFQTGITYSQTEEFLVDIKNLTKNDLSFVGENSKNLMSNQEVGHMVIELTPSAKALGPIDETIHMIEIDKRVEVASPVYTNEARGRDNNLSFNNHIIVVIHDEVSEESLKSLFSLIGVKELYRIHKKKIVLSTDIRQNPYIINQKLKENSSIIKYANLNWIDLSNPFSSVPIDPIFKDQWSLRNTGQALLDGDSGTVGCDVKAIDAWKISMGSPLIVIAIIDTGCNLAHEDLAPQYVQNYKWFDFLHKDDPNPNPTDVDGHGTQCAGIAAACTGTRPGWPNQFPDATGIASLGRNCRIMPIRVAEKNITAAIDKEGIEWALQKAIENKARVVSMSFCLSFAEDIDMETFYKALDDCFANDIVIVAASGNKAFETANARANANATNLQLPARYDKVIAVGASNEHDWRCKYEDDCVGAPLPYCYFMLGSEYGIELSVVAPGVYLHSTEKGGAYVNQFWGTSAATPLVAGLAGLILAYNPTLTASQVREVIEQSADKVGICRTVPGDPYNTRIENIYTTKATSYGTGQWNPFMGFGRVNAAKALEYAKQTYPYQPIDVFIRDSVTDNGTVPYQGFPLCFSPDIIVRQNKSNNPQIEFADTAIDPGSDPIAIGKTNYIYVRVHNKGKDKSNIHVRLYYAPLSTTCAPDQWKYLNQYDFYDVSPNTSAISNEIIWENAPAPSNVDHYCLIASIEGVQDPHPDPSSITDATQYMAFIRENNNISYRNLVFEQVLANTVLPIPFHFFGFPKEEAMHNLRVVRHKGTDELHLQIRLPIALLKQSSVQLYNMYENKNDVSNDFRTFSLAKEEIASINELIVPKGSNLANLVVNIPKDSKPKTSYQFSVQQLIGEKVLGDFQVFAQVLDYKDVNYIGERDKKIVHKIDCKNLENTDKNLWQPFVNLGDATARGYRTDQDCELKEN